MVAEAAADIGDPQVRNRGTIGGSLAHADPAADYPAVMLALDAEIQLEGPTGARVVKAQDFFQGLFTVDLAPDEIIASVQFAPVKAAAYAKLHQRASHFAIVGVAAALEVSGGTICVGAHRPDRARASARDAADEASSRRSPGASASAADASPRPRAGGARSGAT